MKKNWTLMLALFGTLLFGGCNEELPVGPDVITPDPVEKTFTVSASADFGVDLTPVGKLTDLKQDTTLVFVYKSVFGRTINSIKVNGNPLYPEMSSNYKLVGKDSILITVKENVKLNLKSICNDSIAIMNGKWYLNLSLQKDIALENSRWIRMEIEDKLFAWSDIFREDGHYVFIPYIGDNGILTGPDQWSLKNDSLLIWKNNDFIQKKVILINNDSLITETKITEGPNGIIVVKDIYTHFQVK